MLLDLERIRRILETPHSYYAGNVTSRQDNRWIPDPHWPTLIAPHILPEMRVLDVGCGKGHFLLELASSFRSGLGIDDNPDFLRLAEEAKCAENIRHVDFLRLDYPSEAGQLEAQGFDMAVSIRGPIPDTSEGIRAAHRLLRPHGLLWIEEIGELHQKEEAEIFWGKSFPRPARMVDQVRERLEQNGFEVRFAADVIGHEFFPDLYAWLHAVSNIWAWLGVKYPAADDPRFALFAEKTATRAGEIQVTNHVCWLGAIKI
jgi:cyclopropane fatty-acyl-phospholipid synthase-like methyltransferase